MKLTILEVYRSMIEFLDIYYQKTKSDDLGSFLGGIDLTKDNETMDPAAWYEWLDSVSEIQGNTLFENLTGEEAYKAMIQFLDRYRNEINSKDVGDLLAKMALTGDDKITKDPEAWQNWIRSVEKVLFEKSD